MTKCITADCSEAAAIDSALCVHHREKLAKAEEQTLRASANTIASELRQFERLCKVRPPLSASEIALRMVWPIKNVQRMLKKFSDERRPTTPKLVLLESPYAGNIEENVEYARACMRDSLERGEAPIASHLLYTQPGILRDDVPEERQWGISAGLAWRAVADCAVFYTDRGWSSGMKAAQRIYEKENFPFEERRLG